MYDWTHVVDFIFKKKDDYKNLSDEDKEKAFFMINRKFARAYPSHAQFFNNKSINRASSVDIWYHFFIKKRVQGTPDWYWFKQTTKKEKSIATKDDVQFLMNLYDIREYDIDFLIKHYPEDVIEELKKYHKFE